MYQVEPKLRCSSQTGHLMVPETNYAESLMLTQLQGDISHLVKKFLPNFCQWSFMISSTLCFLVARMDNHASTAHRPSFSRMWSEPRRRAEGRS